jgi:hypothetical protein
VRPGVTTLLATLAVAGGTDQAESARSLNVALQSLYGDTAGVENPRRLRWQQTLDEGWADLDALDPKAKQALVEAMVDAVLHDGAVTASEAELLRAACSLMDAPLPALLSWAQPPQAEKAKSGVDQSKPSSSRSVMYLTTMGAETCGISFSGPILCSCTAARK